MVAASLAFNPNLKKGSLCQPTRLPPYLLLAVVVNVLIVHAINMQHSHTPTQAMQPLKISLSALQKPAPMVQPAPAKIEPIQAPSPVITKPQAAKKIAAKPKPAPIKQPLQKAPPAPATPAPATATLAATTQGQNNATVIQEARYRRQTPPNYPRRARELGQQGTVTLHAKIAADGRPNSIKVAHSSGHRLLDRAALAAVEAWEFEPIYINGRAAPAWVRVPVRFVLQ